MELDVSEEAGQAKLFSVPDEIWLKIFCHIDPLDVLALSRSCRFFSKFGDNFEQNIWHYQWFKLVSKHTWLSLDLPSVQSLSDLGVAFKDCCRRLWSILCVGGSYPKCVHCKVRSPFRNWNPDRHWHPSFLLRTIAVGTTVWRIAPPRLWWTLVENGLGSV